MPAGQTTPTTTPPCNGAGLLRMPREDLDALFARSQAGPVPDGEYRGTLIVPLQPTILRRTAALVGSLAWQGKVFDAHAGRVTNRVLPFGLHAVTAEVRQGPSRLDGHACIVLDYARTSLLAGGIRDELRLIRPGLYLGMAYWRGIHILHFALET